MNKWLLWGTFQPIECAPKELPPITPTRSFCIELFRARIEAIIGNEGDVIGFSDSPYKVGNTLLAAKQTLLRVIPYILPKVDGESLYRFVLQHDDLGLHNMSIFVNGSGQATVTSIYDWETANIVPVILSEFDFSIAGCDLRVDEAGRPWVHTRSASEAGPESLAKNQQHSEDFLKVSILDRALFQYLNAIRVVNFLTSSHQVDPRRGTISEGGIPSRERCTASLVRSEALETRKITRKIFRRSSNLGRLSNESYRGQSRRQPSRRRRTDTVGCPGCGVAKRGAQPRARGRGRQRAIVSAVA